MFRSPSCVCVNVIHSADPVILMADSRDVYLQQTSVCPLLPPLQYSRGYSVLASNWGLPTRLISPDNLSRLTLHNYVSQSQILPSQRYYQDGRHGHISTGKAGGNCKWWNIKVFKANRKWKGCQFVNQVHRIHMHSTQYPCVWSVLS